MINLEMVKQTNIFLDNHVRGQTFYRLRSKCKFRITDILNAYWDAFVKTNPHLNIRAVVFKEVEKVKICRTISLGYTMYSCLDCINYFIVPHTC